jgi:hypothetical protein
VLSEQTATREIFFKDETKRYKGIKTITAGIQYSHPVIDYADSELSLATKTLKFQQVKNTTVHNH